MGRHRVRSRITAGTTGPIRQRTPQNPYLLPFKEAQAFGKQRRPFIPAQGSGRGRLRLRSQITTQHRE